jgi:hypothetical protein
MNELTEGKNPVETQKLKTEKKQGPGEGRE